MRQAESEKLFSGDLFKNLVSDVDERRFSSTLEAHSHLDALGPALQKRRVDVRLLAAFGVAGRKHTLTVTSAH